MEYKLLGVCIPSRYSEYLLMVKHISQKESGEKNGIGKFGIGIELINLRWNWPNGIEWNWNWSNGIDLMSGVLTKTLLQSAYFQLKRNAEDSANHSCKISDAVNVWNNLEGEMKETQRTAIMKNVRQPQKASTDPLTQSTKENS